MGRGSRFFTWILVIISVFIIFFSDTNVLAATYPETVRVGLYFGTSSAPSVALNSAGGLELGYYKNGEFSAILTEAGNKQIIIRKDSYFIKSPSGALTEYNPTEGIPYSGETFGPYHIQIGEKVSDYASAQSFANQIKESGIYAYPVFEDGWFVWTGFYGDAGKAAADVKNLASKLDASDFTVIEPAGNRFIVYNSDFEARLIYGSKNLRLSARPNSSNNPKILSVNGRQYRGEIELRRFTDSDMTVINVLSIEEYLYGVVPAELESTAPIEALKAQTVAARTYVYLSMGNYSKWDFDVVNTVASQVYGGYELERASSNQAVNETKGTKVLYNGRLASLFYFSSSGGMTEDNTNVWGADIPYLKSVEDPYESGSSYNYNWIKTFTAEDIKMKLFLSGVEIGDIISMTAEEYTPAGRVNKLKITGTKDSIIYYKEDIRKILGDSGSYLPSRMFTINSGNSSGGGSGTGSVLSVVTADGKSTVNLNGATVVSASGTSEIKSVQSGVKILGADSSVIAGSSGTNVASNTWVLTGKGWGHAVGMSQEGAKGFAQKGYTYDKILMHYFTGVTVE
ncbi:MAG TPA: amidase enhancer [Ruminiclostridium sp.]|nr:amidase enhancer [Ruminiclostridium sp.]